ncbi:nectin-3 isoform X3 [Salmo salar]|uniref:Nectin-3 isoform X3 n=1 Tax=Salmo salar TaxID=8030 RepID=A0ABM3DP57_SALSA|nr:nectin-3-like isoform X3 [Salmo salar]
MQQFGRTKTTHTHVGDRPDLEEEELFVLWTNAKNKLRVTLAMRRAKHVTEAVLCCVILVIHRISESIRVIGGSRTVVQGEDVDLSCSLLETDEELEQITWQKRTLEEPENHNFFLIYPNGVTDFISSNGLENRVQFFGNLTENIGSIRIKAARLLDEGNFTCVFSVFPSGVYSIEIPLTVLVPPVTSVTVDVPPVIGENEVFLASCLAAGAKPQAEVRWNTDAFGSLVRTVTNSTQHANGTTTVVSHLLGVPTRAANQQQVQCVVKQSALATERTLAYTININYPPQTVNITLSEASPATVFLCVADSNPKAIYTWTSHSPGTFNSLAWPSVDTVTSLDQPIYSHQLTSAAAPSPGSLKLHIKTTNKYSPSFYSPCPGLLLGSVLENRDTDVAQSRCGNVLETCPERITSVVLVEGGLQSIN